MTDAPLLEVGRQVVIGTILRVAWRETDFSGGYKATVKLEDGNRIWGSLPRSILDLGHKQAVPEDEWAQALTGRRVQMTVTIELPEDSDADGHFGFYKRPTKATLIEEDAA